MISFTIALIVLVAGYLLYGKYVERVFHPDDRTTPAISKADGVDYIVLPYRPYEHPVTMYVNTANGGTLNVRSIPDTTGALLGTLEFGSAVTVTGIDVYRPDWVSIRYSRGANGTAWVMTKFLSYNQPSKQAVEQAEVARQMATYRALDASFLIAARPASSGGWVNFRSAPSTSSGQIGTLRMGQLLTVVGETIDWYQAVDSATGRLGWVSKAYVYRV